MIQFSLAELRDRIYACWLGKNIGGTLGGPYENKRALLDVKGFTTAPGEPLPNDDLDLQLVWLKAVNDLGPENVNSKVLGEYWLSWVTPNWNEYGVGKANLRQGILPPMSGEYNNHLWRDSNGAWIRTEVWASLYPGQPEKAIRMAFEDASVDHGFGEGTWAAIFVAAMQSAAFVIQDVRELLAIGLSKIPEDCRVARSVRLAMESYDAGMDWKDCRNLLVKDSEDLGWFQAPANVTFVVLGLLYGQGDFKQSMLYAINCGDDTDCTAATIGALMGIMVGTAGVPKDWQEYIGDAIKLRCVVDAHAHFPKTCTALTDAIMTLLPATLRRDTFTAIAPKDQPVCLGESTDLTNLNRDVFYGREFADRLGKRKPYSYEIEGVVATALVEFDRKPTLAPLESLTGRLTLTTHFRLPEQKHYQLRFYCSEGWQVDCPRSIYQVPPHFAREQQYSFVDFTIQAGSHVEAVNRLVIEITSPGRPTALLVPVAVMG